MVVGVEAMLGGDPLERSIEVGLDVGGRREVLDLAAPGADQVMMVVPSEILGQLVARELVAADDAVHHPGLLEHGQVPVGRRLGQGPVPRQQLGDRQRCIGRGQDAYQRPAGPRIALVEPPQAGRRLVVQVGRRRRADGSLAPRLMAVRA